jgi:RNA polymerase sigma-70 factor (ECF subfamily)
MRAVASADMAAFVRLYQCYASRVQNYAYSLISDRAAAEEVLIDTMTVVWNNAAEYGGASSVSTWILGIARHKALDVLRKRGRRPPEDPVDAATAVEDPIPGPADRIDRARLAAVTRDALAGLSDEHREILHLAFYEEMPYAEIAARLSIPSNTVKSRVFYAKQQLRRELRRRGAGEDL